MSIFNEFLYYAPQQIVFDDVSIVWLIYLHVKTYQMLQRGEKMWVELNIKCVNKNKKTITNVD